MPDSKADPAETDLRLAQDLLFFAYRDFTNAADVALSELGLGRAHHRALHFIGRNPASPCPTFSASCASPSSRSRACWARLSIGAMWRRRRATPTVGSGCC